MPCGYGAGDFRCPCQLGSRWRPGVAVSVRPRCCSAPFAPVDGNRRPCRWGQGALSPVAHPFPAADRALGCAGDRRLSGLSVAWSVAPTSVGGREPDAVLACFSVGLLLGVRADRVPLGGRGARDGARRRCSLGAAGGDPCALPEAVASRGFAIRSATGTRSRSPQTCSSSSVCSWRLTYDSHGAASRGVVLGTLAVIAVPSPLHGPESQRPCWESPCGSGPARPGEAALLALLSSRAVSSPPGHATRARR